MATVKQSSRAEKSSSKWAKISRAQIKLIKDMEREIQKTLLARENRNLKRSRNWWKKAALSQCKALTDGRGCLHSKGYCTLYGEAPEYD